MEWENRTRRYTVSRYLMMITGKSKQDLFVLSEKCKVENVSCQKYASGTRHDIQKKMHSSSSNFALIID